MAEKKFTDFLLAHADEDPARLLLSAARWPGIDVRHAARLIEARRKIRSKVPSWHAVPELEYPDSLPVEQCSSEETALYKQAFVPEGARMADLTGGLGVDCWFLSRKAAETHYCERNPACCAAARHNFALLGDSGIAVHEGDGIGWLRAQDRRFDLLYLDPARRDKAARRVYALSDCEPDLLAVKELLLSRSGRVLAKISPMADISRTLQQIPEIRELHVVAAEGQVKELLLLMEAGPAAAPRIVAADGPHRFSFRPDEEPAAAVRYAGSIGTHLFQPSKALLKAGAFRLVSERFGLDKLAPSTHLYTGNAPVADFPGRCLEVEAILDWNGTAIRQLQKQFDRIEMTALNFPLDTEGLRKRTGIPGGGDRHVYAVTMNDKKKILIICKS